MASARAALSPNSTPRSCRTLPWVRRWRQLVSGSKAVRSAASARVAVADERRSSARRRRREIATRVARASRDYTDDLVGPFRGRRHRRSNFGEAFGKRRHRWSSRGERSGPGRGSAGWGDGGTRRLRRRRGDGGGGASMLPSACERWLSGTSPSRAASRRRHGACPPTKKNWMGPRGRRRARRVFVGCPDR